MKHLAPLEWQEVGEAQVAKRRGERGTDGDAEECRQKTRLSVVVALLLDLLPWTGERRGSGITVVELMVVMAIIAMLMGLGAWGLSSVSNNDLRNDANRVAAAIKYTYANAAINNTEYRIVFNMQAGTYHSEIAKEPVVDREPQGGTNGSEDDFLTEEAQRLADEVEEETDLFEDDEENPFGVNRRVSYERVKDGILKSTKLSDDVAFVRIVKANTQEEYREGEVSMSFFPNGFQEQVMIVISSKDDPDVAYTLITEPLTGRVMTYSKPMEIPEGFGEVEEDE